MQANVSVSWPASVPQELGLGLGYGCWMVFIRTKSPRMFMRGQYLGIAFIENRKSFAILHLGLNEIRLRCFNELIKTRFVSTLMPGN